MVMRDGGMVLMQAPGERRRKRRLVVVREGLGSIKGVVLIVI